MASSRKSALGDDWPTKLPHPLPAHVIVPNVRVKISEKPEFSRNSRPMGREGTCMDYKTHWVSNSRKSKKYPAEEGTRGMPVLYGNGSPTPESRKSTQPKRVPAACLFYTEMCIFGHICPPISRKPEFSRHSGACGLRVPPFYCKTH